MLPDSVTGELPADTVMDRVWPAATTLSAVAVLLTNELVAAIDARPVTLTPPMATAMLQVPLANWKLVEPIVNPNGALNCKVYAPLATGPKIFAGTSTPATFRITCV